MKATTSNYRGFCIYKRTRTDCKGKTEYYIRLDGGKKKKSIRALAVEIGMDLGVIPINIHDVRNVIDKAVEIGLLDTGKGNLRPDVPLSAYMHKLLDDYDTSPWIEKERKRGRSLGEDHLGNYERVFRLYISHLIEGMTIRTLSKADVFMPDEGHYGLGIRLCCLCEDDGGYLISALIARLHVLVLHRDIRRSDCGTGSGVLVKDPSPDPLSVMAVSSLCFWIAFDAVVASHHEMLMLIAVT